MEESNPPLSWKKKMLENFFEYGIHPLCALPLYLGIFWVWKNINFQNCLVSAYHFLLPACNPFQVNDTYNRFRLQNGKELTSRETWKYLRWTFGIFSAKKNIFRNKPKLPDIKFTLFLQCYQNNEGYDYSKTTTLIYHVNKYSHLRLDDNISRTSIDNMLIWCHMALPMIH